MTYIGIDPGKNGCMCVIREDDETTTMSISFFDFKSQGLEGYAEVLATIWDRHYCIVLEQVHSMPGQGVASTFSFGQRYGELIGVLTALKKDYLVVSPQKWMKALGIPPKSTKKGIAAIVSCMYPEVELTGKRGGLLDGRSDSLCMALYAKKIYEGN